MENLRFERVTLKIYNSLLHRILAPIEGQFSTSRGMELDVCFGSFRVCFPNSDWKDSREDRSVELSTQDSEP